MIIVDCDVCETEFSIRNENSRRHLYKREGYLNWVETKCPNCGRGYCLFTDRASDQQLADDGVSFVMWDFPPPELYDKFNATYYPDLSEEDEELVTCFIDELQSL